ncbi:MAG: phenylalanine--tRNA ligase subunit beta [Alphaproteobacteria bacterium]
MKFTLSWLKHHLETGATLDEIAGRLTALGLEVEEVVDRAAELAAFTVAHVVEAKPHPDAEKLSLCVVDTGKGEVQVVCGAPNARTGMKGVFARAGLVIPGTGLHLKKTTIRGVESNGMLCSEREMGLGDDHDGIIELPEAAVVGEPFASWLGLDDPLIDVAVTPDRGDCLGVYGIARDLAAAGLGALRPLDTAPVPGAFESPVKVHLDFAPEHADACPAFVGRYIRGVKNGPSPKWLQQRLVSIGLRPISALVDITNWLTLDLGRPAHVFDAGRLQGDLRLRLGRDGERYLALDGDEYEIDRTMTAICDASGLISLAGVMGGASTGCSAETTDVFLEIALFDRRRTAATGRALGIESDARYRFERGVDPAFLVPGAEIGTHLIQEICGGEASELVIAGAIPETRRTLAFRTGRIAALCGVSVDEATQRDILGRLGFALDGAGEAITVTVPSWRHDIEVEADVVEEVLRIHGYDRIPAVSMPRAEGVARPVLTRAQRRVGLAKRTLAARGLTEAVTWSFLPGPHAVLFGGGAPELKLANPISSELTDMRPSLVPNLVVAAGRNVDRGFADVALFEVGQAYESAAPAGQLMVAAALRRGMSGPRHWAQPPRAVDVFDAKADALAVIAACGGPAESAQVSADAPAWYHPGRSGAVRLGPKVLGHFGELDPRVLAALDVAGPLAACEVFLDAIPAPKAKPTKARPPLELSPFQPVVRDFAFVVDDAVRAGDLVRAVRGADKALISEVQVFDAYQGSELGAGKRSLAVAVTLQPTERTLTDAEIEAVAAKIVAAVAKATGGSLRA